MNKVNLSKLTKCDQIWEEMEEIGCGRLCQQCNKTITDFRNLSNEEVARIHMFSTTPVCGVYRPNQLKVPSPIKVHRSIWSSISFTLLSLLFTKHLSAQVTDGVHIEQVEKDHSTSSQKEEKNPQTKIDSNRTILRGRLLYESEPLIGGTVAVVGTSIGTVTDIDGFYSLDLTDMTFEQDSITIRYDYTGFATKSKTVSLSNVQTNHVVVQIEDIKLEETLELISFSVVQYPPHKRFWRKIKRSFKRKN